MFFLSGKRGEQVNHYNSASGETANINLLVDDLGIQCFLGGMICFTICLECMGNQSSENSDKNFPICFFWYLPHPASIYLRSVV